MTRIDEVARDLYRISTPLDIGSIPGGFSFNQYLLVDEEPLLYHTGPRAHFAAVRAAIERVMPLPRLRWIAFGHVESDECGAFSELATAAPHARPLCGRLQAMLGITELTDREPLVLGDGETRALGRHRVRWIDAPHVPHGWDNGLLFEETERHLFAGDLFSQPGAHGPPVTETEVVGPSEALRQHGDYYAHAPHTRTLLQGVAALEPSLLACMHGSAFRGDGGAALRALSDAVG